MRARWASHPRGSRNWLLCLNSRWRPPDPSTPNFEPSVTKHIQRHIDVLKQKILYVGTLVEEAIAKAIVALINRDAVLAAKILEADNAIDRMEVEVEEECLKILALYQPVAADLRFVVAVLKINNDLARMGDLAKNIAKRVVFLTSCERF